MLFRREDFPVVPFPNQEVTVLIQNGCSFEGKLHFEGMGRIDGNFQGEITTPDIVIIGKEGRVTGNIEADVVIISGQFTGEIVAKYRVELQNPALVRGTIEASILEIEEGAIFEGESRMRK